MILECNQFLEFLGDLRFNNNNIPLLVGGDFNMDMKVIDDDEIIDSLLITSI